jgi:hypothetical protein
MRCMISPRDLLSLPSPFPEFRASRLCSAQRSGNVLFFVLCRVGAPRILRGLKRTADKMWQLLAVCQSGRCYGGGGGGGGRIVWRARAFVELAMSPSMKGVYREASLGYLVANKETVIASVRVLALCGRRCLFCQAASLLEP